MTVAANHTVVGLGEILWDCFGTERRPGGAPANVAAHAAQLGARGIVCSRVGNDALGEEICAYLMSRGLSVDYVQRDDDHATGTVTVDATRPDDPKYVIHEDVAWDHIEFTPRIEQLMQSADAVCFGTLAQRSPTSAAAIQRAVAAAGDALVVFDVNLRQNWYTRDTLAQSLRACSALKINAHELTVIDALLQINAPEPGVFAARLAERYGIELICVTRGSQGCLLWSAGEIADTPGRPVHVVDAVGAGDAFCGALITARLKGWPLAETARFANEVGALVASRAGAVPDLIEPYAALVRQFEGKADV
ncbi:MAG: carbohydrate kinase [Phycisphaerales bacterium]|nr:carbohydrate kinase [Phycisphaerales bacterium]